MCFTIHSMVDLPTGNQVYTVVFNPADAAKIKLDNFDMMVLNSPEKSVADVFHSWQLLAFRYQQQFSTNKTNNESPAND